MGISSLNNLGVHDLLDVITSTVKTVSVSNEEVSKNIAIVGRPNVGKSSLINALVNDDRVIVDDLAGTTRDAIDVFFTHHQKKYIFIDTAGISKKSKTSKHVDFYAFVRSNTAIARSDLVILVLDGNEFMTHQDKRIIQQVIDAGKPMLIYVNKWDLSNKTHEERQLLIQHAQRAMPNLEYYPFLFGSALKKLHINKIFEFIPSIINEGNERISTPELNRFLAAVIKQNPVSSRMKDPLKFYYVTQAETAPPLFVFFVNNSKRVTDAFKRYLERKLRENLYYFKGIYPINLVFKNRVTNFMKK